MENGGDRETKTCSQGVSGKDSRKLVLHFDVRNTVLVADSITDISVGESLNSYLTGVTWGRETENGWKWESEKPTLTAPVPGPDVITYYKHLEKQLVKEPSDRAILRKLTGDFSQEDIGRQFEDYYLKHLKMLEWPYPDNPDYLTLVGRNGNLYHYIIPAFFKLLQKLYHDNREFAVILRTYGLDASNVLSSIKQYLDGNHPQFQEKIPLDINLNPGNVTRSDDEIIFELGANGHDSMKMVVPNGDGDERRIYDRLSQATGVCGFVDDFLHWSNHNFHHHTGKPVWIDTSDTSVQHIIFDDNIRVTDEDSIVDLRLLDPVSRTARSLKMEEMSLYEDKCLVQADLLKSTSNENYFIEKVKLCEENYSKFLESQNKH